MLTDDQRLAVVRELWDLAYRARYADAFAVLWEYERRLKERQ